GPGAAGRPRPSLPDRRARRPDRARRTGSRGDGGRGPDDLPLGTGNGPARRSPESKSPREKGNCRNPRVPAVFGQTAGLIGPSQDRRIAEPIAKLRARMLTPTTHFM